MFSLIKNFFLPKSRLRSRVSFLICGIGNKGDGYENTRHNIGFSVIDALLKNSEKMFQENRYHADTAISKLPSGEIVVCVKPQTYVNRSGTAVKHLLKWYNLPLTSCLIIVDDFNLPLGSLRFRRRGSDGGHNGLRSIISETGDNFPRLRIGIGPVPKKVSTIDFVLGTFAVDEIEKKNQTVALAADAVDFYCKEGINKAMNQFNI